jgi:hypothetical protein
MRNTRPAFGSATARRALALVAAAAPLAAHASFLSGDALDTMADIMAWVVMIVVPCALIVLFWMIHVLPEKIAHRRHHPQRDAIKTLCLLSLAFGGLLWPLAWLWAYTRPTGYKAAYGTEKHDDYYTEMGEKARAGTLLEHDIAHLRDELDAMAAKGHVPPELKRLRQELDQLPPGAGAGVGTHAAGAA